MIKLHSHDINYLVVHCALTMPSSDVKVHDVRKWHLNKGWSDVGYHFFITRSGELQEGRSVNYQGAHVKGFNGESIGICLAGGMNENANPANNPPAFFNYTFKQLQTLVKLLNNLIQQYPGVKICGHKDLDRSRTCPGFDVAELMRHE